MYFEHGEKEISYLKQKDKHLAEVIEKIGMIERTVDNDLFASVVHHIIGQQISTKAQATIWQRILYTESSLHNIRIYACDGMREVRMTLSELRMMLKYRVCRRQHMAVGQGAALVYMALFVWFHYCEMSVNSR